MAEAQNNLALLNRKEWQTMMPALTATVVSGSVTATVASTVVSSLTNFGTGIPAKEMADDINNLVVTMANINNANG